MIDTSRIHYSWMPHIRHALEENLPRIEQQIGQEFLPPAEDVFTALSMPLEDVRVLIVGQDPYPTPGHAMGLSFSTRPGVAAPRSLKNIYAELQNDLGISGRQDGDLRAWSEQGVLLLNRVLTVAPGQAVSHRRLGWEAITEAAIRALAGRDIVAILWGRDAQSCQAFLPGTECITSPHPSPLSARRGFFGSAPFSRANAALEAHGVPAVDWRL